MSEDYEAVRKRRNARAIKAMREALAHVPVYATVPGEAIAYYVDAARSVRGFRWGGSGGMQTFFKAVMSPQPLLIRGKEYVLDPGTRALHRKGEPVRPHNLPLDVLRLPFTPVNSRVTVREDAFLVNGAARKREHEWRAKRQMLMFNLPAGFSLLDTPGKTYGYQVVQHHMRYLVTLLTVRKRVDSGELYIASKQVALGGEVGFPASVCYLELLECRVHLAYDGKTLYIPGAAGDTFFTMASKRSVDVSHFHANKNPHDAEVPGLLATYRVAYDNTAIIITSYPVGLPEGRTITLPLVNGLVEIADHSYMLIRDERGFPSLRLVATSRASGGNALM
jgi:hypothetical protein